MKIIFSLFFTLITLSCFSQNRCSDLKTSQVITVIDELKFKPRNNIKGKIQELKKLLLAIDESSDTWNQICIDSWYACEKKSDNYYKIWVLDYGNLSKGYWTKNCKALICLLFLDTPTYQQL